MKTVRPAKRLKDGGKRNLRASRTLKRIMRFLRGMCMAWSRVMMPFGRYTLPKDPRLPKPQRPQDYSTNSFQA